MGTEITLDEEGVAEDAVAADDDARAADDEELAATLVAVEAALDAADIEEDASDEAELESASDVAVEVPETAALLPADDDDGGRELVDEGARDSEDDGREEEDGAAEEPDTVATEVEDCAALEPVDAWDDDVAADEVVPLVALPDTEEEPVAPLEPLTPPLLPSPTVDDGKRQKPFSQT